ncbi:energy transducer TonB [Taibaiella koreensis]|uniref:energy transducer TonB n=1 Tax=Taibaiella koreensis TaxID=1268548 RepID=UPI000E599A57|nr:energy transducer TonB [Taibaiella koreensis]
MSIKTIFVIILSFLCGTLLAQEKKSPTESYITMETEPRFSGEPGALSEFVANNLVYPPKAKKRGIEGKVVAKFVITEDGTTDEVEIIKGIAPDCDKEVIRMIKSMPKWEPGKSTKMEEGKMITRAKRSFYTLPVNFRLRDKESDKAAYSASQSSNTYNNKEETTVTYSDAKLLYKKMEDENADSARNAFIMLTEIDPKVVSEVAIKAKQDNYNFFKHFLTDRFLVPIAELTQYCRSNNIDYKGSARLQGSLDSLCTGKIDYATVYEIENKLINTLTPEEITAVEYWALINEMQWRAGQSAGRILNKFYSLKWQLIVSDKRQLNSFLKKARIYSRISIAGSLNLYLTKFNGCNEATRALLRNLEKEAEDNDIKKNIRAVLSGSYIDEIEVRKWQKEERVKKFQAGRPNKWPENLDVLPVVINLADSMEKVSHLTIPEKDIETKIHDLAEFADYNQLGTTLLYLRKLKRTFNWNNTEFIQKFFGVPVDYNGIDSDITDSFLSMYNKMDEIGLYQYYLNKTGLQIKDEQGSLDYKKVYEILKFDLSIPFTGQSKRDFGVFAVIKILESTFDTRLGMPARNEHRWGPVFKTFLSERRNLWITYLRDHNLIAATDTEPPSFTDYDVY